MKPHDWHIVRSTDVYVVRKCSQCNAMVYGHRGLYGRFNDYRRPFNMVSKDCDVSLAFEILNE